MVVLILLSCARLREGSASNIGGDLDQNLFRRFGSLGDQSALICAYIRSD
jgi:hypothetical protein